jgi:Kef-type K+ transport system membrane component KefB
MSCVAIGEIFWPSLATTFPAALQNDPILSLVLYLSIILVAAKIGGDLAIRIGQPSVLGELIIGVLLGNLTLLGYNALEPIKTDNYIYILALLGVLVLLFEVGLESTVPQMIKVGLPSIIVASLGVIAPFILGWAVGIWLLPDSSNYLHAFLGATLCATSVGITARVLQDLSRSKTKEARIILGAAVVDDVLGLIVLAVVTGLIQAANLGVPISYLQIGIIIFKAATFLLGSLTLGLWLSPKLFRIASKLQSRGVLLCIGLGFCFSLAWIAGKVGLAPIVGAFAAGLILEDAHYKDLKEKEEHSLEELIHPISSFLVPIFFVLMGMRTDLKAFTEPGVIGIASALTIAAIVGKQVCSLGVIDKTIDRLSVGIGMIPRGEVGLIFANIGLGLSIAGEEIISKSTYSAIIVMVIVTTMITPPALKWSFGRKSR